MARKKSRFFKEITTIILIKLCLIFSLWYLCFSNPVSKKLDSEKFAKKIYGNHNTTATNKNYSQQTPIKYQQ